MLQNNVPKSSEKFVCELCNYNTSRYSQYQRHLMTLKHKNQQKSTKINTKSSEFTCICGKSYKERSGLWRHKNTCAEISSTKNTDSSNNNSDKELIMLLLNDNKELRNLLIEQVKEQAKEQCKDKDDYKEIVLKVLENGAHNTNTITTTNSHNKTFNLNMFLNETCKDAMNITEFMDSIQLQLSDLEDVGDLGYINGISNIIIKKLKALDVTKRPIHCTDVKREILYVKDQDKWEKEGEQKDRMLCFVKNVANMNIRMLTEYKKRYPDCGKYESKYSDRYNKLIIEAMGGGSDKDEKESNEKIIKKISKEVAIEK
jgi:hypothetical protein